MARPKTPVAPVRVTGPLAPYASAFRVRLAERGYSPLTAVHHLRLFDRLSWWLEDNDLRFGELTDERFIDFVHDRRVAGFTQLITVRAMEPAVGFLREVGLIPDANEPAAAPTSTPEVVLSAFRRYLIEERGLAESTTNAYLLRARRFVAGWAPTGDLARLSAASVVAAIGTESQALSVGSAQFFVVALRSFLRFCALQGLTPIDLSGSVLPVTGRRTSSLPLGIPKADADALLGVFDRRRPVERRDHAIVLTILRLGLRASEVAALTLDDIDWRAGEIVVHGKGHRDERLPLPVDVGEAIAGYLRHARPTTGQREVFVTAIAPIGPIGRGAVSSLVRRACRRAGIEAVGAHRLRHTMACEMINAATPLPEIGQALRHRSLTSTLIYAGVDIERMRPLARPWPTAGAGR